MKFVRVRIRRGDRSKGEAPMTYPTRFDPDEVHRHGIGHIAYSGHLAEGGDQEWTIIGLDDAVADEYATDPDMEIVDAPTADADMEAWRIRKGEPAEQVRDPNRLAAIQAKQQAGIALTAEDMEALDPESSVPGINRVRTASDYLAKAEAAASDIAVRRGAS